MTRPRPSRKARWAIGLSLVGLFSLITLGGTVVAFGQLLSGLSDSAFEDGFSDDGWADSTARATIIDVDVYDLDDRQVARSHERYGGTAGYAEVDIEFVNNGRNPDGALTSVTWMHWPDDRDLPNVGDEITIGYHAEDPENDVRLADPRGSGGSGVGSVLGPSAGETAVLASSATTTDEGGEVSASVRWTIVISGLLALLSLVGTLIWVRGAPAPERAASGPPAGWNPNGPHPNGWNQGGGGQPGWNQGGWNQAGWNQGGWNQGGGGQPGWGQPGWRERVTSASGGNQAPAAAWNQAPPNQAPAHPNPPENPDQNPPSPPVTQDWQRTPPPTGLTPPG